MKNVNIRNHHLAFRVDDDFNDLLNLWSKKLDRSKSAIARYAVGQVMQYFDDQRIDIDSFSNAIPR